MGNGLDLMQAGDAALNGKPPFLTSRQQKQVEAAALQRVNALLAGPDGALDINDAATRVRIKEARGALQGRTGGSAAYGALRRSKRPGRHDDRRAGGRRRAAGAAPGAAGRARGRRRCWCGRRRWTSTPGPRRSRTATTTCRSTGALPLLHPGTSTACSSAPTPSATASTSTPTCSTLPSAAPRRCAMRSATTFATSCARRSALIRVPRRATTPRCCSCTRPNSWRYRGGVVAQRPYKLRFRLVPTTTRQPHPGALQRGAQDDHRARRAASRSPGASWTRKGTDAHADQPRIRRRPLSAVFVGDDALDDKARHRRLVEQGLEIESLMPSTCSTSCRPTTRMSPADRPQGHGVDRGADRNRTGPRALRGGSVGRPHPGLEVLQADYVAAMQRRAAAQAAAKATTKAARCGRRRGGDDGGALSAEVLLRRSQSRGMRRNRPPPPPSRPRKPSTARLRSTSKGSTRTSRRPRRRSRRAWAAQQAAEYLDALKARFIDSEEPYVPYPTRSQSEPAATPMARRFAAPAQRWTPTACASCASVSRAARCATTTTICSTRCFRGPTRRRCGCTFRSRCTARCAHAAPLARWHHRAAARRLPRARRARRRRRRRRRRPRRAAARGHVTTVKRGRSAGGGARRVGECARPNTRKTNTLSPRMPCAVLSTGYAALSGRHGRLRGTVNSRRAYAMVRRARRLQTRASHRREKRTPGRASGGASRVRA